MGNEKGALFYDEKFENSTSYHVHYKESWYYVHWTQIIKFLKSLPFPPIILEVGCGTGQLAHYLFDEGFTNYSGFDFSNSAIKIAKKRIDLNFFVGDALSPSSYTSFFNTIVCTEVLEHINDDLSVLKNFPKETKIIFSVPNFDEISHVRWFINERQIKKRYFKLIDIKDIVRIGNIFIIMGERSDFSPNFFQSFLASREKVELLSFMKRLKHRIKNLFKLKNL